jgi:hypothetical protein
MYTHVSNVLSLTTDWRQNCAEPSWDLRRGQRASDQWCDVLAMESFRNTAHKSTYISFLTQKTTGGRVMPTAVGLDLLRNTTEMLPVIDSHLKFSYTTTIRLVLSKDYAYPWDAAEQGMSAYLCAWTAHPWAKNTCSLVYILSKTYLQQ